MKIVASNSLTLSKVNDGTITHTAWAYSADGTDRFTTTYPNLNLLYDTTFKNYTPPTVQYLSMAIKDGGVNNKPYVSVSYNNPNQQTYANTISWGFDKEYFKPSTTYTFSFYLKGNGVALTYIYPSLIDTSSANGFADGKVITPASDGAYNWNLTNEWVRHTYTFITKSNITASQTFLFRLYTGNSADICLPKVEEGSTATSWMPSSSEVTTADWPSYRGEYSDFSPTSSTDPSKYSWGVTRGNDGVGVTSTDITYANSTSGTTAPSTGWTSSVPTLVKGQYLWTKTVWTYTDTSSKTGYSVSYISKDGTNGTNGTSGIIVSSVAPDSPQTGQLWQDTSTTPQLVKKWTGSSWVIWELYVENMNVNNLSALSTILGDIDGGTLKLMADDIPINGRPKMYGIYQSKLGLISSGPTFETAGSGIISDTQMGVVSVNKGEMRFIVTDYTEDLKTLQESGMSDQDNAFIKFASYEGGNDVMTIGSSGDIVFKGNTSQDTPWVTLSSGVKYKFMFSRVYISVNVVGNGGSFMQFGTLPQNLRPISDLFLIIANQGAGTADDRHMMVRASDGAVVLWTPKSGITYSGEVSFTL